MKLNNAHRIRKLYPDSIRARLSVLFCIVFGVSLIATSFICFKVFTRTHLGDFDSFLFNHALDIASDLPSKSFDISAVLPDSPLELRKRRLFSVSDTYSQLSDAQGEIIARSENLAKAQVLPLTDDERKSVLISGVSFRNILQFGKTYRLISYRVENASPPMILQIAAPLTLLEQSNTEFLRLLLGLIPCTILIAGILGYAASRRAFSPVVTMIQKTAQIEVSNLKERIEVRESDAELKELGKTLNQLLDRIEQSFSAQERFIADASHQLKTPLAILRGELELLQAGPVQSREIGEGLKSASQEVTKLIRLVENLLLLARMDAGLGEIAFQPVRLDELLSEAMTRLQYVAKQRGIKMSWHLYPYSGQPEGRIDFELPGDADLLRCLMENLIENAVKYSLKGGAITVNLKEEKESFCLQVIDQGRGMSEDERSAIFQRFWRDPKKSISISGAGLGLAITKKISDIHGGQILVESEPDRGATFSVRLRKN
jgi:signal transduction histidine kinase